MPMSNKGIIYLTGVGRSGTTMLQSMLYAHSKINFSVETHFFKRHILPYMKGKKLTPEDLKSDSYFNRLPEEKKERLLAVQADSLDDLRSMFRRIMGGDEELAYLGDKDTEYVRYFTHLKKLFPEAYMIHIIRDPRDVVASRLKTEWGAKRSVEFHIAEYQYYLKKARTEGVALFGDRYLELRYEMLIDDPKSQLTSLLDKLGLEFEPEMLNFHKGGGDLVAADEKQWKSNVSKPLDSGNQGKWKKTISTIDAAALQHGFEDFFLEQGYEMVSEKPSAWQLTKIKMLKQLFVGKTFKERLR